MDINNPTELSGLFSVGVAPIMALATERGKEIVTAEPLTNAPRLVMDVIALFVFATLTAWVEGKIRLLCFCILFVFTLAFAGCIPQPSSAFEALRSFQRGV